MKATHKVVHQAQKPSFLAPTFQWCPQNPARGPIVLLKGPAREHGQQHTLVVHLTGEHRGVSPQIWQGANPLTPNEMIELRWMFEMASYLVNVGEKFRSEAELEQSLSYYQNLGWVTKANA